MSAIAVHDNHRTRTDSTTDEPAQPRILVVVSSTRPGGNGAAIGRWVSSQLAASSDVAASTADLGELALPLLDEPRPAMERSYTRDHTLAWSRLVDGSDAVVFVTPEYNRSMPGSLKNALDFLYWEWRHKPAGFVSYSGGPSGGIRAVEMTKQVLTTLSMFAMSSMVNIPHVDSHMNDGEFVPPDGAAAQLGSLTADLVAHVAATAGLRR